MRVSLVVVKVLEIIFPIIFLSSLGFTWVRLGFDYPVKFVTRICMNLAVPCLVFTSLMNTTIETSDFFQMLQAAFGTYLLVFTSFFLFIKSFRLSIRTYLAPLTFGNTGNIGLPLIFFAFGEVGLGYGIIFFSVTAILSFTLGIWCVTEKPNFFSTLKEEPLVLATIIGTIFLLTGWETPTFLTSSLDLISQMAIPLMLITIGVAMAGLQLSMFWTALLWSFTKLLVCLFLGALTGFFLQLSNVPFMVLLLQICTPVAVTSYLIAEKYNADSATVASLVLISTLVSLIALPIILYFCLVFLS